jgi:nicotinate-nucleotide pyrophosphorylase (carboxylating)
LKVDFIDQDIFNSYLDQIIQNSLAEDIGSGDHTSLACIPEFAPAKAKLLVKDKGIIAGIDLAEKILKAIDTNIILDKKIQDGSKVDVGDIAFILNASSRTILSAERTLLNFMQLLSGIATKTNHFVRLIKDFNCILLDTRKTTPGLRLLEKWAVQMGGGQNHRIGLYDMILIKDNHIDYSGGITQSVQRAKKYLVLNRLNLKIEVEIRNFVELEEVLTLDGIDRLLLDNFSIPDLEKALTKVNNKFQTEASGNINETNIAEYAETGVNFISCGALTHSIKALDLSLKIIK